jgi:hypothetical protein
MLYDYCPNQVDTLNKKLFYLHPTSNKIYKARELIPKHIITISDNEQIHFSDSEDSDLLHLKKNTNKRTRTMPSLTEEQKQKLIDFINKIESLQLQQVSASIKTYLLNSAESIKHRDGCAGGVHMSKMLSLY